MGASLQSQARLGGRSHPPQPPRPGHRPRPPYGRALTPANGTSYICPLVGRGHGCLGPIRPVTRQAAAISRSPSPPGAATGRDLGARRALPGVCGGSAPSVSRGRHERTGGRRSSLHRLDLGLDGRLRRGDIWTVAGNGDYAGKLRPAVILQDDRFDMTRSVTVCGLTTNTTDAPLFRLPVTPSEANGLRAECRLMVDKTTTVRRLRLGTRIRRLADKDIVRLNRVLVVFLGIAGPSTDA
jgi:mRNA interferase MazF